MRWPQVIATAIITLTITPTAASAQTPARANGPNILVILVDDK